MKQEIKPLPGQMIKDRWENTGYPMQDDVFLMMAKINELVAEVNSPKKMEPNNGATCCKPRNS